MAKDKIRQIGVVLATIVMLFVNVVANIIPIYGVTTGSISETLNTYFEPARYAFSIWGVIFLGLSLYSIYQALPAQKTNQKLRSIGWWYIGSGLTITAWMVFFHYQLYLFTLITMFVLVAILVVIYEKLDIGRDAASPKMRYLVHMPFSIYLGWITMVVFANVALFLQVNGWKGFGIDPKIWTVVMMAVTIVIAELTAFNRQDLVYLAVFVWAFIGIAVKHVGVSPIFEAACVSAGIVVIITVITLIVRPKLNRQ
ncbi:MAG: tryptophan-rich sensory protein [Anaerolineaceae bacterium]